MTYWQGLIFGGAGLILGFLGHWKLPKDSVWWLLAVILSSLGGAMAVVAAARLFVH